MKNLNETERAFVISILNRSRYFNAAPSCFGTRSALIETRLGYHDTAQYAALLDLGEPKKSGTRWRVRTRGQKAEALIRECLPDLNERAHERAQTVLDRINADALPRREDTE